MGIYGTFSNLKSWPQWHTSLNKDIPPKSPQAFTNWESGLKMPEIYETPYPKYHRCVPQRMSLPSNASRHRNPELCLFKSLRIFNILIICRNEVKMPLLWKESFPCLSHSISKRLISKKLIKGYIGLWLISHSYCWCSKQAMWVQPFRCRLFHT